MNFTVEWSPSALSDLADIWNNAADQAAVTAAANAIDDLLGRDPVHQGESRAGNTRILSVVPLAVFYDVEVTNHQVTVWDVWRWPTA
jgi:plasmid stabilization system protein ParE